MSKKEVLIVDTAGGPRMWATTKYACEAISRGKWRWNYGEVAKTYIGGKNAYGIVSRVDIHSIVGLSGPLVGEHFKERSQTPKRSILYARDYNGRCAYCGKHFPYYKLTIDHIHPRSKGGAHSWKNCITACKRDNHAKGDKTLEECGMKLLFEPFVPNVFDEFIYDNPNLTDDQYDFLIGNVSKNFRE